MPFPLAASVASREDGITSNIYDIQMLQKLWIANCWMTTVLTKCCHPPKDAMECTKLTFSSKNILYGRPDVANTIGNNAIIKPLVDYSPFLINCCLALPSKWMTERYLQTSAGKFTFLVEVIPLLCRVC